MVVAFSGVAAGDAAAVMRLAAVKLRSFSRAKTLYSMCFLIQSADNAC